MKIEAIKETLADAVTKAEKIAGRSANLPILKGLHLLAHDNVLDIKATNLDLGISVTIPVKIKEEGDVVVPANILSSFINSLSKEKNITLESDGQTLKVSTENFNTIIKTLSGEEFPIIPRIADDEAFSMPARDLVLGIRSVVYAAAIGSMKPELSSIYVYYEEDKLVFVATDSFRLAEKKVKVKKIPHFKSLLIPEKNAIEIARIFDGLREDISISIGDNQIAFYGGNTYLVSRIIDGSFLDYRQVIPKETSSSVVVLKQDLVSTLKTSMVFSDSFNQLLINIDPKNKKFEIQSRNNDVGESAASVEAVVEGENLSTSVNYRYFTDCFQSISGDTVSLSFSGSDRPIVVEGAGDKSFIYLVMPMNRS
jgi:DNA polymerase III subunit beta